MSGNQQFLVSTILIKLCAIIMEIPSLQIRVNAKLHAIPHTRAISSCCFDEVSRIDSFAGLTCAEDLLGSADGESCPLCDAVISKRWVASCKCIKRL